MNIQQAVLSVYPKASDCLAAGHHSEDSRLSFFEEMEDDRTQVMIVPRCTICGMANGADDYATSENRDRFYAGLEPLPQVPCKNGWCRQSTSDKSGYCIGCKPRKIEVKYEPSDQ